MPKDMLQKEMDNGYRPSLLCIEDPLNPGKKQGFLGKSDSLLFLGGIIGLHVGPGRCTQHFTNGHPHLKDYMPKTVCIASNRNVSDYLT